MSANMKSYVPCWLAQQRMTLSGYFICIACYVRGSRAPCCRIECTICWSVRGWWICGVVFVFICVRDAEYVRLIPVAYQITEPGFSSHWHKFESFWLSLLDLVRRCRQYIFTMGDRLSRGDILATPAGKYITRTCSLAVCCAEQVALGFPAAAALCDGRNLQTYVHR